MSEWTWLASPLVAICGFFLSALAVRRAIKQDVAILATKMGPLEAAATRIGDKLEVLIAQQARHDERIQSIERDRERIYTRQQRRQSGSG